MSTLPFEQKSATPPFYKLVMFQKGPQLPQSMGRLIGVLRPGESNVIASESDPHIRHSKEMLFNTARGKKGKILILGAGPCSEIPVELFQWSSQVDVVDLDVQAVQQGIQQLSPDLQEKVTIIQEDITGTAVDFANDLSTPGPTKKIRDIPTFLNQAIKVLQNITPLAPNFGADYDVVVSSLVLSQLFSLHRDFVNALASNLVSGIKLEEKYVEFKMALAIASGRLMDDHISMIASSLGPQGRAYIADTIMERRTINGISSKTEVYNGEELRLQLATQFVPLYATSWEYDLTDTTDPNTISRSYTIDAYIVANKQGTRRK